MDSFSRRVADCLETFKTRLGLENFDNAEWILRQWVERFLKKGANEVWEVRMKGKQGNMRPVTDFRLRRGNIARCDLPALRNTSSIVVIRWVLNGNSDQTSSMQLQALYTNLRHWEELIDFIQKKCGRKEPCCVTAIYKCILAREELDEEYMGLYAPGQMMNDTLYGQISFNSSLSNAVKMKPRHNVKLFSVEMKAAIEKDIAEHVMRLAKVIPSSQVTVSYAPPLTRIFGLCRDPMKMKEWSMRRLVGERLTVVVM